MCMRSVWCVEASHELENGGVELHATSLARPSLLFPALSIFPPPLHLPRDHYSQPHHAEYQTNKTGHPHQHHVHILPRHVVPRRSTTKCRYAYIPSSITCEQHNKNTHRENSLTASNLTPSNVSHRSSHMAQARNDIDNWKANRR